MPAESGAMSQASENIIPLGVRGDLELAIKHCVRGSLSMLRSLAIDV